LEQDHNQLKLILKKKFETFESASLDDLIKHGLTAIRETLGTTTETLTNKNVSVGIVGENQPFEILEGSSIQPYLQGMETQPGSGTTPGSGSSAPMES